MIINNEINRYQWNDQILKWIMHKNKQSESEIVPWQQVMVRYNGNKVSSSIKLSHAYQRIRQRSNNIH